jgi:hypothetical protein
MATDRFAERMRDPAVAHDTRVVADFIQIWCDGHHAGHVRAAVSTDGAAVGIYRSGRLVMCSECAGHLSYAEKRRAFCPKDPKPFCAHCDSQCYNAEELAWQRGMMRYSGPRSWRKGHAIDGIKHGLEALRHRRRQGRRDVAAAADDKETR